MDTLKTPSLVYGLLILFRQPEVGVFCMQNNLESDQTPYAAATILGAQCLGAQCTCSIERHIILHQLVYCFAAQLSVLHRLLRVFTDPEDIWNAGRAELGSARVNRKTADAYFLRKARCTPEAALTELRLQQSRGLMMICRSDPRYPTLLQRIAQPPLVLYVRGNASTLQGLGAHGEHSLAIVGSRAPSEHGLAATRLLAARAAQLGVSVVSGLALGIDVCAHEAVVRVHESAQSSPANSESAASPKSEAEPELGRTIAVLGGGISDAALSPRRNRAIAMRIIHTGGAIISEYPFDMESRAQFFPERNRIIAGMCSRTLVIEAAARSGSLITARHALEENRDVLAVPGEMLNPKTTGTNALLAAGAQVIYSVKQFAELLQEYLLTPNESAVSPKRALKIALKNIEDDAHASNAAPEQLLPPDAPASQLHIVQTLITGAHSPIPLTFSNLLDLTELPYEELQKHLTLLELSGIIERTLAGEYHLQS